MEIKLNLGASPIWRKEGLHILDHKLEKTEGNKVAGDGTATDIANKSFNTKISLVLSEINMVLSPGGVLRLLNSDLKKLHKRMLIVMRNFFAKQKKKIHRYGKILD